MKKKIILGVTVCLFTMATMFSFNMSQQSNISDISLKNIAAMSQANAEWSDGCDPVWYNQNCSWDGVAYTYMIRK